MAPMNAWIDLVEYAAKYGVSQSTLRRRIRSKTISFKMEKGKYLLEDSASALGEAPLYSRISQSAPQAPHPLEIENRRLRGQISELETLIKALEANLQAKDL
ncbi:MAG: hypothetical protein JST16_18440 [Bdellovibrionales bacterium]|nr:hypothetical protein [Bdellovibrionales bacterium]